MDEHAAAVIEELQRRMETLTRLTSEIPEPPDPRPTESDAVLKRKLSRLKAGLNRRADLSGNSASLIDALEREREYRRRVKAVLQEARALWEFLQSDLDAVAAGLLEQILTLFNDAKHLPAASDPNSDVSEFIRKIDRARRAESGRPRRK